MAKKSTTKKTTKKSKKSKDVITTGKRKTAVARAHVTAGKGEIRINSQPLELWGNEPLRLWITEPLVLAGDSAKTVNMKIVSTGGGLTSQAEAIRIAIAKGLVRFTKDKKLKNKYMEHDRNLLVYDSRRTEPHKPSRSKKGARRHKQRSKR